MKLRKQSTDIFITKQNLSVAYETMRLYAVNIINQDKDTILHFPLGVSFKFLIKSSIEVLFQSPKQVIMLGLRVLTSTYTLVRGVCSCASAWRSVGMNGQTLSSFVLFSLWLAFE